MKQPPRKYDITQCALYKCRNKNRLEKLLCLESGGLKQINTIIRYHSFEIDKKQSSVCKTDDYSVRTKFAKSDTKDDDLIKMITYLLNHDQLDSNRKVKIIRDTIDICRRIDEIN